MIWYEFDKGKAGRVGGRVPKVLFMRGFKVFERDPMAPNKGPSLTKCVFVLFLFQFPSQFT